MDSKRRCTSYVMPPRAQRTMSTTETIVVRFTTHILNTMLARRKDTACLLRPQKETSHKRDVPLLTMLKMLKSMQRYTRRIVSASVHLAYQMKSLYSSHNSQSRISPGGFAESRTNVYDIGRKFH